MTPERWQMVRGILQSAMVLRPDERAAFLDRECASDPSLRKDVDEYLSIDGKLDKDFLESPAAAQVEFPVGSFAGASALAAGTRLGNYEVRALLGAGGMGQVYRARDLTLKREVAIKIIPHFYSSDPARLHRFRQEAEATAALNHPNILTVYQVGQEDTTFYIVAELLHGDTLRERLKGSPLSLRTATDHGVQIARGLAAAHESGVIHRDLKPENIFVTRDGRIKILDFGLAKLIEPPPERRASDEKTRSTQWTDPGSVLGTTSYMSPEQVRGDRVDHHSDIFAFGAVLYEMLTGHLAFAKPTAAETMTAILNEDPPTLSQSGQNIPPGMHRVILRCLEKQPERRFQSASDLAFALEALSDSGNLATGIASRENSARRMWLLVVMGALVFTTLVAVWFLSRPLTPPRISAYTQITHDGRDKELRGTDGSRLYFTQSSPNRLAQVSVSGGEIAEVPIAMPAQSFGGRLRDVSRDGSNALIVLTDTGEDRQADSSLWIAPILGGAAKRLDNGVSGDFSPDGSGVIYSTEQGDIFLVRIDGTGKRKLANAGSTAGWFRWSPDGKTIRFNTAGGLLWEMNSDGSAIHRLLPEWKEPGSQCCGAWTSDGSFYLFELDNSPTLDEFWALDERRRLFRQRPSAPVRLTTGPILWRRPIPSRDGKIFSVGVTPRGELSRVVPRTGALQPSLGGISAEDISFSSNGKSVAYVSYPDGILWKADRDGSNPVRLSGSPNHVIDPRWSPDSKQILFFSVAPDRHSASYLVSAEGGIPRKLIPEEDVDTWDANWSPDGTKVLFDWGGPSSKPGKRDLRILDVNSRLVQIVPGSAGFWSSRWSPDGRYLAALAYPHMPILRIFDITTEQWTAVPTSGDVEFPCFSHDSRFIYFLRYGRDQGVFRIPVTGGKEEREVDMTNWHLTGYFGYSMTLDPTDAPLVLRDVGSNDIYALTLEEK
jgi:eukaryotic-like serine/threonine-protein kinase